jgi:hypothetical protein
MFTYRLEKGSCGQAGILCHEFGPANLGIGREKVGLSYEGMERMHGKVASGETFPWPSGRF